jgi:hypothetical protein
MTQNADGEGIPGEKRHLLKQCGVSNQMFRDMVRFNPLLREIKSKYPVNHVGAWG